MEISNTFFRAETVLLKKKQPSPLPQVHRGLKV